MRDDKVIAEVFGEELAVTPSDLYTTEFKRNVVGGYAPAEVDEMLERVADVMESLILRIRLLKEKNEEQNKRLEEYRQMESTLHSALVASQKFGDNILESAQRQAETILEEARVEREKALLKISRMPYEVGQEIDDLRQQRDRMLKEIRGVLEVHRNLLDSHGMDIEDVALTEQNLSDQAAPFEHVHEMDVPEDMARIEEPENFGESAPHEDDAPGPSPNEENKENPE